MKCPIDTGAGPDWWQQELSERARWAAEFDAHDSQSNTNQRNDTKGTTNMGRYATENGNGGDFQEAPVGTHVARCIRMYDIGTHTGEYQGKVTTRNQLVLAFELPEEKMDDGQPFIVHKFWTNSLHEKANMRHDLEAWRGRPFTDAELKKFDLQQILDKCCLLSVIEKNGKARAGGIMALPKGTKVPPAHNDVWAYWIDEHDEETFAKVPKGFQKLVMESQEMRKGPAAAASSNGGGSLDMTDDVPFTHHGSGGLWRCL